MNKIVSKPILIGFTRLNFSIKIHYRTAILPLVFPRKGAQGVVEPVFPGSMDQQQGIFGHQRRMSDG
jgi:hypothetical protein